jgi:hypothetical protein
VAASSGAVQTAAFGQQVISTLSSALAWGVGALFAAAALMLVASLISHVIHRS